MLEAASAEDLELEMRKLLFLLDYKGARAEELQKIRRSLEDPMAPGAEESLLCHLTRDKWQDWCTQACSAPARYVVPGQSVDEVRAAVCSFIALVKKLEAQRTSVTPSMSTPQPNSPHFDTTTAVSYKRPHPESEDAGPNKRRRIHDSQAASTSSNVASDSPTISSSTTSGQAAGSGIPREDHPFFRLNEHAVLTDEQKYSLLRHSRIRKFNAAKCEASGLRYVSRFGRIRQGTIGPSYSLGKLKRGREDEEDPLAAEMHRAIEKARYSIKREHGIAATYGDPKYSEGPPILTEADLKQQQRVCRPRTPQYSSILRVGGSSPIDADALRAQDNDCADLINDNFPPKSVPLYQAFIRTSSEPKKEDKPQDADGENMSSPRRPESSLSATRNGKVDRGSNQGNTPSSNEIRTSAVDVHVRETLARLCSPLPGTNLFFGMWRAWCD
ncbi:hypothetical protein EIP86_002941 [Pleurotus ostreatoroseus]|nr:hypothetical protein EIP86_002941 [Pleurotus ostreatoroseus]